MFNDKVSGKTPIAVVVYIGSDNCGQALALQNLGNMAWSTENVDIPTLANYTGGSAEEKASIAVVIRKRLSSLVMQANILRHGPQ